MTDYRYEKDQALWQYLLFHYGSQEDQLAFKLGLQQALDFPVRCVSECLNVKALPKAARGLELGCAVGRSSFELSRYCDHVLAIDNSKLFIEAANEIQKIGQKEYRIPVEGVHKESRVARLPDGVKAENVDFICGDALDIIEKHQVFDVVLAANLLCRIPDPFAFLAILPHIVAAGGQFILISPYSWLTEFSSPQNWLGGSEAAKGKSSLAYIQNALQDFFQLIRVFDMPFIIREHVRKYELGVSQATIWIRK